MTHIKQNKPMKINSLWLMNHQQLLGGLFERLQSVAWQNYTDVD